MCGRYVCLLFILTVIVTADCSAEEQISPVAKVQIDLTTIESDYLSNRGSVSFCVDPDWMPFEAINQGNLDGMTLDYSELFSQRLGVPFKLVVSNSWKQSQQWAKEGKCDILPMVSITEERQKYLSFTKPYLTYSVGIITRDSLPFISGLSDLANSPVGIVNGYSIWEYVRDHHSNNRFVPVDGIEDGLLKVSSGKISAFLIAVPVATYHIKGLGLTNLKVAGHIEIKKELRIGISQQTPELKPIISKLIDSLKKEDNDQIYNKWVALRFDYRPDYWHYWKEAVLLLIAIIAITLWNRKLHHLNNKILQRDKELKYLASHDPLTNTLNRRSFYEMALARLASSKRYKRDTSMLLMDIDNFKRINDTYGHPAGDQILIAVALRCRQASRETDIFARYGGEEFIFLLEEANEEEAMRIAERLRESINNIADPGNETTISASIGVCHYRNDEETLDELINRTDQALYLAKSSGRNNCKIG